jgi:hypothetical protein
MNNLSQELYESLRLKYNTEIQEYKTTLFIFFENSIGIGDHANHIDEMNLLIEKMTSANDKLKMLNLTFGKIYAKL